MNTFKLEGPGGIPGLKLSKGHVVQTDSSWQFNDPVSFLGGVTGQTQQVVDVTGATKTLTAAQSGAIVLLDVATTTVTLPADAAGLSFTFVVKTAATAQKVIIATASSYFQGELGVPVAAGTQKLFFGDASTLVSINLNGSTTGGLAGGSFTVTCLKSGLWQVNGNVEGSGTVATPFATS